MELFNSNEELSAMLAPLQEGEPVGQDLRENISPTSSYQVLRDARTLARNNERAALASGESMYFHMPDWTLILEKVPEVLKTESKDIELVAWYIEGLTRFHGFAGLASGFSVARQLIASFGEALYPRPDEDGIATQLAPLIGLNGFGSEGALIAPIKSIPITQGDYPGPLATWECEQAFELARITDPDKRESRLKQGGVSREALDQVVAQTSTEFLQKMHADISAAIYEFELFQQQIDAYCPNDPQPTGKIKEALKACLQTFQYIAGDRIQSEASEAEAMQEQEETGGQPAAESQVNLNAKIVDRQHALKLLREVADFFRKTEPHSPISYSVEQTIRWSSLPLTELIKELIPEESARKKYQNLSGMSMSGQD
ncbi:type VI secretion system protein TssA [Saccharophagus degradans]|uniref:type VI secretion system protein TssA n=1 Tax=Saccharophagus degradans TaxID=86304 RepID=UPI001C08C9E4|nr:type VI secretion system protein TssA [Saccharophagus degradans]MBU2987220.1 type VI secretion system protein TssA [Saccharophagus degradans]